MWRRHPGEGAWGTLPSHIAVLLAPTIRPCGSTNRRPLTFPTGLRNVAPEEVAFLTPKVPLSSIFATILDQPNGGGCDETYRTPSDAG
jgi:hypothetical protein